MTLAIILAVAAALALVFILSVTVSRSLQISQGASLAARIQPIDVEAFRNLIDPAEDEYLRRRLTAGEFRRVRRQRLHAMAAYVQTAGRNAAVLILIAQGALTAAMPRPLKRRVDSWTTRCCCGAMRRSFSSEFILRSLGRIPDWRRFRFFAATSN